MAEALWLQRQRKTEGAQLATTFKASEHFTSSIQIIIITNNNNNHYNNYN